MKYFVNLPTLFLLFLLATATAQAQQYPPSQGFVNDFANVIDPDNKQKMETILKNFRDRSGVEIAVVTVTEEMVGGLPWEEYTLNLARAWGTNGVNNAGGALIVVQPNGAPGQRHIRVEVSRHLEGDVPDALAGTEIDQRMLPYFRAGRFGDGLMLGVQTLVATIAARRGISIDGVDQQYAYRGTAQTAGQRGPQTSFLSGPLKFILVFLFFLIIWFIIRVSSGGGPRGGLRTGAGLLEAVLWSGVLFGGNRGGGGGSWGDGGGGGGGGSDGGGGGGDWGGFSGGSGGGDFGGGGSSDSW